MEQELKGSAFEAGKVFYETRIVDGKRKLDQLSLELETFDYVETLEQWEIDTMKLRQLERRHNLGLLE
jgi:hypothetical protein